MPTFRSLTVHVTDHHDNPLKEYGVRKSKRGKNTSCYVQSENNMAFRISIKPSMLPWPEFGREMGQQRVTRSKEASNSQYRRNSAGKHIVLPARRLSRPQDRLRDIEKLYDGRKSFSRHLYFSDIHDVHLKKHVNKLAYQQGRHDWDDLLLQTAVYDREFQDKALECLEDFARVQYTAPNAQPYNVLARHEEVPYHVMAVLRLDGKSGWEKRSIIYLDEQHLQFRRPDGEMSMKYRTVRGPEGELRECGWYFSEFGIETVLDKLFLSDSSDADQADAVLAQDEEDLLSAFSSLGANGLEDVEEKVSAGQIELIFERVTIGRLENDAAYHEAEGEDSDVNMSLETAKVSHIAARDAGKRRKSTHDVIYFEPYVKDEPPFATFRFYYRAEETLRKLGFSGFRSVVPAPNAGAGIKQKKAALNNMVPLSITTATPPQYLFDDEGKAIAEIEAPKIKHLGAPMKFDKEILVADEASKSNWKPVDSQLPGLSQKPTIMIEPPDSPPDSPSDSPLQSDEGDEDAEDDVSATDLDASVEGESDSDQPASKSAFKMSTLEVEQSSAEESSPLEALPSAMQPSDKLMTGFRKMGDAGMDDGEADDEASHGRRSMSANDGSAEGDKEDIGIAQNKNDEGIGERLKKIPLGKRLAEVLVNENESPESKLKKARMVSQDNEQQQALESEHEAMVETTQATELAVADADMGSSL